MSQIMVFCKYLSLQAIEMNLEKLKTQIIVINNTLFFVRENIKGKKGKYKSLIILPKQLVAIFSDS